MIKLNLENKVIVINTHNIDDKVLYNAHDLMLAYGLTSYKASSTIKHWRESMSLKLPKFQVVTKEGKFGGTYLTKHNLLKLAGYISYSFEDAVYESFEELANKETNQEKLDQLLRKMYEEEELIVINGNIDYLNGNVKRSINGSVGADVKGMVFGDVLMSGDRLVTVCSSCSRACCWHGEFMCSNSYGAGTKEVKLATLIKMHLEHIDNFSDAKLKEFGD